MDFQVEIQENVQLSNSTEQQESNEPAVDNTLITQGETSENPTQETLPEEEQEKEITIEQPQVQNADEIFKRQQEIAKNELHLQLTDRSTAPISYYKNNEKEIAVLDCVDNFNRQYSLLFPGRKTLFLAIENEFNLKKFVCTTIRPTQLPFKEIYDYQGCAKFIANYIEYTPLDPPHELPTKLSSPTYTLKTQQGNSFDMSVLLTCLLCGVGYDAYVVSGYANANITLLDTSDVDIEKMETLASSLGFYSTFNRGDQFWMVDNFEDKNQKKEIEQTKYKIKGQKTLGSLFLAKMEKKKNEQAQKLVAKKVETNIVVF